MSAYKTDGGAAVSPNVLSKGSSRDSLELNISIFSSRGEDEKKGSLWTGPKQGTYRSPDTSC
jgi:hypothetical protein